MTHTTPRTACLLFALVGLTSLTGCGAFPGLEIRVGGEKSGYAQSPPQAPPGQMQAYPNQPPPTYTGYPPPTYTNQPPPTYTGHTPPTYAGPPPPACTCGHSSDHTPVDKPVPPPPVSPMPSLTTVAYMH